MFIKCFIFFLLFNVVASADPGLERAIEVAIESRFCPDQQNQLTKLIDDLTDFTRTPHITTAIAALLKERLNTEVIETEVINLKETSMGGKSRDLVFLIYGKKNQPAYIVKAFQAPNTSDSYFLPELSAMTFILKGDFNVLHTAEPLAVGKCHVNGVTYALLVESVAPGKRLVDYIYAVGFEPKQSASRKKALQRLKQAMSSAGKGFGELQKAAIPRPGLFPQDQMAKLDSRLSKYLDSPTALLHQHQLPVNALKNYIRSLIQRIKEAPHYFVYSHGDAHTRNCLYDSENDIFTLIDLGRLHESMDGDGTPWGQDGYDFMRFLEDVQMKSDGLLSQSEVQEAQQAFRNAYKETTGSLPSEVNQEFYTVYRLMARLEQYADYVDISDRMKREERYRVFMYALNGLSNVLRP